MADLKTTELGKSYWAETGVYQAEYEQLYKDMVEDSGASKTLNGELIRAISRLFYEYCNNGNCNAVDVEYYNEEVDCYCCDGEGEINHGTEFDEEEGHDVDLIEECYECCGDGITYEEYQHQPKITDFYVNFLDLIKWNVPNSFARVEEVEEVMLSNENTFSNEDMDKYNKMCDTVIHYVLENEDKELPIDYKNR